MGKHRSPNCPQISFAEAIEKGRKVYEKEHTHPAPNTVVAGDLGYSGLNGRSLTQIGALRQYGILEGTGDALHVTEDAVTYFEMDDGPEKSTAIQRMAFAPALFAELKESFKDTLPSEGNLRHNLIQKGFLSKAADDVIRVYKANLQLVSGEKGEYTRAEEEKPLMDNGTQANLLQKLPSGIQSYAFALSPNARAELSLKGTITVDDLDVLRDHIELTIRALSNSEDRRAKQKKRIMTVAEFLCNGCEVQFQDHGSFIWFKVLKDGIELIPYSEDRTATFYEGLSDTELATRLKALGAGRL